MLFQSLRFLPRAIKLQSQTRFLRTSQFPLMASQEFEKSKSLLSTLQEEPGNDDKLKLYGLFKQATTGTCTAPKPGMMDFVAKAKWQAWSGLGTMQKEEAEKQYIEYVQKLAKELGTVSDTPTPSSSSAVTEGLAISNQDGVTTIRLNRPNKKNALTQDMYKGIVQALKDAAEDKRCNLVYLTGTGDYYCSGNDLSNFTLSSGLDVKTMATEAGEMLRQFVAAFIDFPKPLVAAINGHAVGISVTTLGLCDLVYSSDKATFHTPFSQLGQAPEACSSYIFPKIMGASKANELLLINKKITVQEAFERNLISEIIPHDKFEEEMAKKLQYMAKLPTKSLVYAKQITRDQERETLHKINRLECERLVERWQSDDCMKALMSFFQRKSNL